MAESQELTILEKIQPAASMLQEIVSFGLEVINDWINRTSCHNWRFIPPVQKLIQL